MTTEIIWYDELDSTNSKLQELQNSEELREGTIIVAKGQCKGRGQQGNKWFSTPGRNLTFSILIRPTMIPVQNQFLISQTISLAIVNTLEKEGIEASIKWPNDIYVGEKKICGILIENRLLGAIMNSSIIGIGLNVNEDRFPEELPNPTSMLQISGKNFNLENLLETLLGEFFTLYDNIDDNKETIISQYSTRLFRKSGVHPYFDEITKEKINGSIIDISQNGQLTLLLSNNEKRSYYFKEVSYMLESKH